MRNNALSPGCRRLGFGGQLIEIVPDLDLVVVVSTPRVVFSTSAPLLGLVEAIATATSG
jgi:hypothetical protein